MNSKRKRLPTLLSGAGAALAQRYRGGLELPPVSSRGFWYLPYTQEPERYETRSIADVLEGRDQGHAACGPASSQRQGGEFRDPDAGRHFMIRAPRKEVF